MLNIVSKGGTFDPWVKYNSKAGRFYIKGTDGNDQEVQNPVFVVDFDNLKTGWINFVAGMAPDRQWDQNLSTPAAKPSEAHKRGFSVRLFSKSAFGGVVELSSSSMHLCAAINDLYIQYDAARGSNAGKLPVVKYTGSTPQKDKMGTNYKPNFVIEKWVDRPAEFAAPVAQATPVAANQPAQAAPVAATGTGSEF